MQAQQTRLGTSQAGRTETIGIRTGINHQHCQWLPSGNLSEQGERPHTGFRYKQNWATTHIVFGQLIARVGIVDFQFIDWHAVNRSASAQRTGDLVGVNAQARGTIFHGQRKAIHRLASQGGFGHLEITTIDGRFQSNATKPGSNVCGSGIQPFRWAAASFQIVGGKERNVLGERFWSNMHGPTLSEGRCGKGEGEQDSGHNKSQIEL